MCVELEKVRSGWYISVNWGKRSEKVVVSSSLISPYLRLGLAVVGNDSRSFALET